MNKFLGITALALGVISAQAGDWPQFRGPNSASIAVGETALTEFKGEESVAWKLALPGRGLSSPIVIGENVIVTCSSGANQEQLHVFCINTEDGNVRWERRFWATGRTMTHGKTNVAAPTPCSDGERIFAIFSSNDLVSLDLQGNLLWLRGLTYDYPNASNSLGLASSPVFAGGALVIQSENDSESFAAGIDPVTGTNLWRKMRPKRANWTSPIVIPGEQEVVALQSTAGLMGIVPRTGSELWNYSDGAASIPSSAMADGVVYIPSHGITALRPSDKGGEPEQLWRNAQIAPGTGSPVVVDGKVLSVSKAGVLSASAIADGERLWRIRTDGPFSASPVVAGTHLYLFNERGTGQIVNLSGEEGTIVSSIEMDEQILCTPAISGGAVYVRSDAHLWKFKSINEGE